MYRLGATSTAVKLVAVVAVIATELAAAAMVTSTVAAQRRTQSSSDWFQATVDRCNAVGWPQCVAQKVARTIRLLEDPDGSLQIAEGVRLVKTAKKTDNNRSAKNYTSDFDVIDRIVSFVDSHSLQFDLWTPNNNVSAKGARRRHAYRKVFPVIVGTYMIMSAVLLPLGFMFMSTLGGKALLFSKIALMVSLMSNVKKIFSYEYHVPQPPQPVSHHHWKRTLPERDRIAGGASPLYSSYNSY